MTSFESLTSAAREVLMQLFVKGPTWDGHVASKSGRSELVEYGLAFRWNGWQSLTEEGLQMAVEADVKEWHWQMPHKKQRQLD